MGEKALISGIGLTDRDLAVIQSVFKLVGSLQAVYSFVGSVADSQAAVVFVNADDAQAVKAWRAHAAQEAAGVPIFVSSNDAHFGEGVTLRRPLAVKTLIDVLLGLSSGRSVVQEGVGVRVSRPRILVVDDSVPVQKFMGHKIPDLSPGPVDVDFASSGEQAAEKLRCGRYDLVFLDVMMPGDDGYKVCKWIKSQGDTPVVLLTGKKSPFDKVRGAMSGCDGYITKPPDEARLRGVIEQYCFKQ